MLNKMMNVALIALSAYALTACQTTREAAIENCKGYGFEQSTKEFAVCVQNETIAADNRKAAGIRSLNAQTQNSVNSMYRDTVNSNR